jgi:hypothetical protein
MDRTFVEAATPLATCTVGHGDSDEVGANSTGDLLAFGNFVANC